MNKFQKFIVGAIGMIAIVALFLPMSVTKTVTQKVEQPAQSQSLGGLIHTLQENFTQGIKVGGTSVIDNGGNWVGPGISPVSTTTGSFSSTLHAGGNFDINTNKFTVAASSGNTAVAGTFGVTGASTLAALSATTGSFSSTLAVTGAATFTLGQQSAAVARTATSDGLTTGTIANGTSFVTVTSADANNIIVLPAPTVGNVVRLANAATGYELRSSAPASVAINGGTGSAAESAIGANVLTTCVARTATAWICMDQSTAGTVTATEVAAP